MKKVEVAPGSKSSERSCRLKSLTRHLPRPPHVSAASGGRARSRVEVRSRRRRVDLLPAGEFAAQANLWFRYLFEGGTQQSNRSASHVIVFKEDFSSPEQVFRLTPARHLLLQLLSYMVFPQSDLLLVDCDVQASFQLSSLWLAIAADLSRLGCRV